MAPISLGVVHGSKYHVSGFGVDGGGRPQVVPGWLMGNATRSQEIGSATRDARDTPPFLPDGSTRPGRHIRPCTGARDRSQGWEEERRNRTNTHTHDPFHCRSIQREGPAVPWCIVDKEGNTTETIRNESKTKRREQDEETYGIYVQGT